MGKFFSYLGTSVFRKNLLIAIASVFAFVLVIFFCLGFYTFHGESTPVPRLEGMPLESAISLLEANGLNYQVDSVYDAKSKPGRVVLQDPDDGTMVKRNRTIYLTVNTRNAPDIGFPDILGRNFLEVKAIIANYGLVMGDTTYAPDIERDRVIEAKFASVAVQKGQEVPKGSRIDLVLGDGMGASEVDIPDLTGLDLSSAMFLLKDRSLHIGIKEYEGVIKDSSSAIIIKQFPALSDTLTKVPIGSRIDVVFSNP